MYTSPIQRIDLGDVALRSVVMEDIGQSVVHLSNHIISSLPKKSRPDGPTSEVGTSGIFEGTLGFLNHTKFFQNLCGGPRSWKIGEPPSFTWVLERFRLPVASKPEKLTISSKTGNVVDSGAGQKLWTEGAKSESRTNEENPHLSQRFPSVERSGYSSLTETNLNLNEGILESLMNSELSSGAAVSKEDLGRATWTFLHTLAAQFPDSPTKQQQRDAKELMSILSRIYPCKECADHFKDVLKAHPVEAKSAEQLAQWMCRVHNVVNRSLGKAQFPCQRVDLRWGALDCNEGACDLQGRHYK